MIGFIMTVSTLIQIVTAIGIIGWAAGRVIFILRERIDRRSADKAA